VLLVSMPAWADLKVPTVVLPEGVPPSAVALAQPVKVRCLRGYAVQVRLNAATAETTRRVEFLVRTQPRHGQLGEIVPVPGDNDVALVTYQCNAPAGVVEDRFTYGARVAQGRVSAAVDVIIEIVEPEPVLEMTQEVNFGRVMIGMELRTELEIMNTGLKAYEDTIVLPTPWKAGLEGKETVRIEPGKSVRVPIYFRPDRTGKFQAKHALMPDEGATIYLGGEGVVPCSVDQDGVRLTWDATKGVRTGSVWIREATGTDQILHASGGGRLTMDEQIVLGGDETVELVISLPATDVVPLSDRLRITSGHYESVVDVMADAAPAVLEMKSLDRPEFHFGFVPEGVERSHTFVVRNRGGAAAPVKAMVSQGFRLEGERENFLLTPGEEMGVTVVMETKKRGAQTGLLTISGAGAEFRITLSGTVIVSPERQRTGSPAAMERAFATDDFGGGEAGVTAEEGEAGRGDGEEGDMAGKDFWAPFFPVDWEDHQYVASVPSVQKIFLKEADPYRLELYWEQLHAGLTYSVEFEAMWLDPEAGVMKKLWVPVEGVKFRKIDGQVHARIDDLQPGSSYVMRVLAINPLDEVSRPSTIVMAWTPDAVPFPWKKLFWAGMVGLLVVLLVLKWVKAYRNQVTPVTPVSLRRRAEV
jgi:hypothetical protein